MVINMPLHDTLLEHEVCPLCEGRISELITEIENQKKAAEEANSAKSAFLSTISHEIRSPMNAILGVAEIQLMDGSLEPGVRDAFEKIHASGDILLSIINDLLDLSKIEAGKLDLHVERYEVASLISDVAQLNMMRVGSKQIEFELQIDENVPAFLTGDELRVKQILNNLLSNAFKYTESGTVKFSLTLDDSKASDDEVVVVLSVSDTGQGMTKQQVDMLFEEYTRFNQEANRTTEGTGLGMSITRNLVQMMNGEIAVESEPDKGTTFTVHLPQRLAGSGPIGIELAENLRQFRTRSLAQMKRVQVSREPMPYGRILLVDDVETNIYVAKGLLTPYELSIDTADSGFAAIEKIESGKKYDIIFMDHMMPKMDGIETTRRLREMGYELPIVALTASAVAGQADIFFGSGFDDFISKPIDIRHMNVILNRLVRDKISPEMLTEARKQTEAKSRLSGISRTSDSGKLLAEAMLRDAQRSLSVLEELLAKDAPLDDADLRTFVIHVHGMKGALANIRKVDLSAAATKLEDYGRVGNFRAIASETPAFLSSLRELIRELQEKETDRADEAVSKPEADISSFREKLHAIKAACGEYDETTVDDLLTELRHTAWPQPEKTMLGKITEMLLHSEFDEIANLVDSY